MVNFVDKDNEDKICDLMGMKGIFTFKAKILFMLMAAICVTIVDNEIIPEIMKQKPSNNSKKEPKIEIVISPPLFIKESFLFF